MREWFYCILFNTNKYSKKVVKDLAILKMPHESITQYSKFRIMIDVSVNHLISSYQEHLHQPYSPLRIIIQFKCIFSNYK